ncbi:hypothetical protein L1887_25456 [Cichorium endivia]|nr:hypothetical protein L1887_25456 [Cichorium endivia]
MVGWRGFRGGAAIGGQLEYSYGSCRLYYGVIASRAELHSNQKKAARKPSERAANAVRGARQVIETDQRQQQEAAVRTRRPARVADEVRR